MSDHTYLLTVGQIFTIFFVMLGPLRLIGPFTQSTQPLAAVDLKKLVTSSTVVATISLFAAGILGSQLLAKWEIDTMVMSLAGGILFFIAALRPLIFPPHAPKEKPAVPNPATVALELELTPYGIATTIVLMSSSDDDKRTIVIFLCLFIIMLLNAFCMMYGRQILRFIGPLPMKILGTALGVLQLGLATEIIVKAVQHLKG